MGNMKDANILMDEIKKQAETLSESDLLQFITYLLETLVVSLLVHLRLLLLLPKQI